MNARYTSHLARDQLARNDSNHSKHVAVRVGEASQPGPMSRDRRRRVLCMKDRKGLAQCKSSNTEYTPTKREKAPCWDKPNAVVNGENTPPNVRGPLVVSTYNGNCAKTGLKWVNESPATVNAAAANYHIRSPRAT